MYDRQAKERQREAGKIHGRGKEKVPEKLPEPIRGDARDKAGKAVGVSGKYIDYATKVINNADPEVVKAVDEGRMSVVTAAVLSSEPPETQRKEILDGRRRWRACQMAGVRPVTRPVSVADPVAYVLSLNLHRRHLTPSQLSMVAARVKEIYERRAKERQKVRKGSQPGASVENLPHLDTGRARDHAGKAAGVSGKYIDYATKVINNAVPEVVQAVDEGRMSVVTAAIGPRGLEHFRATGEALIRAKEQCGHGKWLKWLEKNVKFGQPQASKYMRIAAEWEKVCLEHTLTDALRLLTDDADDPGQGAVEDDQPLGGGKGDRDGNAFSLAFRPPVARHWGMSRRTRRVLLLALPAALAVGVVTLWLLWPRTAITRANAAMIREGMTRTEVEALLGGPPRDEYTGPLVAEGPGRLSRLALPRWGSDRVIIWVSFDAEGRVDWSEAAHVRRGEESFADRFRRWLGR